MLPVPATEFDVVDMYRAPDMTVTARLRGTGSQSPPNSWKNNMGERENKTRKFKHCNFSVSDRDRGIIVY